MIRTLWYLVKISLVLGIATYLATLPGEVVLEWQAYHVTVQMGFLAVSAFIGFLILVIVSGVAYRIVSFPRNYSRYRQQRRHEKGYQALLRSLTSAAMGDYKNARYLAHRAQKFLPEAESGLPLLLQAQAIREMDGESDVDEPYQMLLKNAETSLLGLQGLIQNAILSGDLAKALLLSREAVKKYPKNYQLLRAVYDLEIKNRLWNDALITLDQAVKHKIITRDDADHDRVAIYCALGDMALGSDRKEEALAFYKKSVGVNGYFVPAVTRLARLYQTLDQRKKAEAVILKAWKKIDHPDLISLWGDLMPPVKAGQVSPRFKRIESVSHFHKGSHSVYVALARAAIEDGLWGDARANLAKAEKSGATEDIYRLWVLLEEMTERRPDVIRQWLDRAYQSPKGAVWVCPKSGRQYAVWQAVIEPEGLFNTLEWREPVASETQILLGS
ncbi:MAG: hypothetical protein AUJ12_03805 [Alphaproteobacteria bacterium CG1_02_46_17]|nr:MAG: hypothetical protein AUJ12_03805 [Alphaproteobacteria bacterium CG1_02_46_17]